MLFKRKTKHMRPCSLQTWIWQAFVRSSLIPLILVETVLIAVYLLSNTSIHDAQIQYLHDVALRELEDASHRESSLINDQLSRVHTATELYRNLTTLAFENAEIQKPPPELELLPSGVRYSPQDTGGAASFYSGITPPEQQDLHKVAQLKTLDPLMKQLKEREPLVASVYFNSWDSYNHIYPWFHTASQYQPNLKIPDFNFYYLADAQHNPKRQTVWTEVYLDPAGNGWMMSAISPVYKGEHLEGVVGLDITVDDVLKAIDTLSTPWNGYGVLVSNQLDIMALPKAGERDFGLHELTHHSYDEAIRQELFKPEDFNLQNRPETRPIAAALYAHPDGLMETQLNGSKKLISWHTIPQTGWRLLMVVDEHAIYFETEILSQHYKHIGYLMIAGLLVFYLMFFSFQWWRARGLSRALQKPILNIQNMMAKIGQGQWQPEVPKSGIQELNDMAERTAAVGLQLKQSERQRNSIQQRLEIVLGGDMESLWEYDLQRGVISLRGGFCQHFGLSNDSISEAQFLERLHPEDRARFRRAYTEPDKNGQLHETEFRFRDAQQRYHWLLGRGQVVDFDPNSHTPSMLAGTYVNINALKQTEEDLRQASLEAQAANQAKSRFISSVSHELRTPLNAIHGFAQLMQLERETDPTMAMHNAPTHLHEILVASQHLGDLVNDLLDWANIQAEKPKLKLRQTEVAHILQECGELVRLQVLAQELKLTVEAPNPDLQVWVEPRRLRQILLNLLSNAIKYNRPQGYIRLGYRLFAQQQRIRLQVEDSGFGISPELQSKLFEPFQRLGKENTAIQGTGIGLALCREYASLLGGEMGLSSELGVGSCFWIELPLSSPQMEPTPSESSTAQARIFYIDPDAKRRDIAEKVLNPLGITYLGDSGKEALQKALVQPPQLLILSTKLADITAEQLQDAFAAHPSLQNIPTIFMAAPEDLELLMGLSFQGILPLPFTEEDLYNQAAALLEDSI
ncbi:PAS domain-containing protein [Azomonas agilis]|uniref:histidine kinase n=2 Tax=Azomonas agilis TaxID=116849 RepID=A0A562IYG9_9GAMM|nr:PAS domain-containing protein [Azomonas agilis]